MTDDENRVIENFLELSKIPRCSGNEKEVSNYLRDKYLKKGFNVKQDKAYNIYIQKEASEGNENKDGIIIQTHMDMVCVKTKDSNHDFSKDPIEVIFDKDIMTAKDTTLGADDGVGVAMALSLLEENIAHPALELLITTNEETGMDGAIEFDKSQLKGKYLINLDSDEEGIITSSCAGGVEGSLSLDVERKAIDNANSTIYEINLFGLKGGHSGTEISEIHINSIKISFELLDKIRDKVAFDLIEFSGGTKHNAIPNSSTLLVAVNNEDQVEFEEAFNSIKDDFIELNLRREPDIEIVLEKSKEHRKVSITEESFKKINSLVQLLPHGVFTMDENMGIPESSDNFAILNVNPNGAKGNISIRSSSKERIEEIQERINSTVEYAGGNIQYNQGYPGWEYNPSSKLREELLKAYKTVTKEDAEVKGIHAGLECGLFAQANPELDIASIGPNLYDIHTVEERASLSSIDRVYKVVLETIKNLV